jgi:hypothetical protein
MPTLLSDIEKTAYSNVFNDIHDTFSRDVIVWKTPKKVVVSTNNNHNFLYNDQESLKVDYIPVSGTFKARVEWGDPSKLILNPDIRTEIKGNVCRLKVKQDFINFMDGAAQVEIDGRKVEQIGSNKPHGLFDIDFYTLFFKESD